MSAKPHAAEAAPDGIFLVWTKIAAQSLLGLLLLCDSLYLIIRYVTSDFYGFLSSPFFSTIHTLSRVLQFLYFPVLAAALLFIAVESRTKLSRSLAGIFLVLQTLAGLILMLVPGPAVPAGWTLLYGPNLRYDSRFTYPDALLCLLPLLWIGIIHTCIGIRGASQKPASSRISLAPSLLAGLSVFALYAAGPAVHALLKGHRPDFAVIGFSLLSHLLLFTTIFLCVQFLDLCVVRFNNAGLIRLVVRSVLWIVVVAVVLRKILLAAFAFNNKMADIYSAVFSFTLVFYIASLLLSARSSLNGQQEKSQTLNRPPVSALRILIPISLTVILYLVSIQLTAIDWNHALGGIVAFTTWILIFWALLQFRWKQGLYAPAILLFIALADGAGAGLAYAWGTHLKAGTGMSDALENYSNRDASFFAMQQILKPGMRDEKYNRFYSFLIQHTNIRQPVAIPDGTLATNLTKSTADAPNIFIFVIDALRKDYLSPYNEAVHFTPQIQAFADENIVFRDAYTPYGGTALAEPAIWAGFQMPSKIYPQPLDRMNNLKRMLDADGYLCFISYDTILNELVPRSSNVTVLQSGLTNYEQKEFSAVIAELETDLLKKDLLKNDHMKQEQPKQPLFVYSQPENVHTLSLTLHSRQVKTTSHPGFDDQYASVVEDVDSTFGQFVRFLKIHGMYENSIIILTADHGESLGEMGRRGHVMQVTPEIIRVPLLVRLPERLKSRMRWDPSEPVSLHDLTPSLYYLLGHRPVGNNELSGRPLFMLPSDFSKRARPDHYFFMSSYMPVFGILAGDEKHLYMVDASRPANYFYDLEADPVASRNVITPAITDKYAQLVENDLRKIDKFYGLSRGNSIH